MPTEPLPEGEVLSWMRQRVRDEDDRTNHGPVFTDMYGAHCMIGQLLADVAGDVPDYDDPDNFVNIYDLPGLDCNTRKIGREHV